MTKKELFDGYQEAKDTGKDIDSVILYIHMPGGEEEIIINPDVPAKLAYIDRTYDDTLIHANCKDIYITDAIFTLDDGEGVDFGTVLCELKDGRRATRKGWNGKGMWIELCTPPGDFTDEYGDTYGRRPYMYMKAADNTLVPWVASQTDLLAEDWEILDPPECLAEAGQDAGTPAAMPAAL